jgi:bifunctional DNA-binding transcriptional regulator/antitoxin component of YhaV-PrlF toxin-antitoxin module
MTRVKLRRDAEITLPKEICDALHLVEGDELEAELRGNMVVLQKPGDAARAEAGGAWAQFIAERQRAVLDPEPSEDEVMQDALEAIAEVRRERRARRSR